jgi:hypothetical protein
MWPGSCLVLHGRSIDILDKQVEKMKTRQQRFKIGAFFIVPQILGFECLR